MHLSKNSGGGELEIVDFFKGIEIIMYKSSENG